MLLLLVCMKIVILLGAPGSGKGTMAGRLAAESAVFHHLSSGNMLREAVSKQTPAGRLAEGAMKRGELVSDELVANMIKEYMAGQEDESTIFLDGFPRTVAQAEVLGTMIKSCGAELRAAVLMDVKEEALIARIAGRRVCSNCGAGYHIETIRPKKDGICDDCGGALVTRKDDNLETVRHRLKIYRERTVPVLDFYQTRGLLRRVVGDAPISEVVERVKNVIDE